MRSHDDYTDIFRFFDERADDAFSKKGDGYFRDMAETKASRLRREALGLNAYLNMYEGTGEREYLKGFHIRVMSIFGGCAMPPCVEWNDAPENSWNLVGNPYFDGTLQWAEGWDHGANASLFEAPSNLAKGKVHSLKSTPGSSALTLISGPAAGIRVEGELVPATSLTQIRLKNLIVEDHRNFEPESRYSIEFWARVTGSEEGRIEIFDETAGVTLSEIPVQNNQWMRRTPETDWISPSVSHADHKLCLRIVPPASDSSNIEIYRIVVKQFAPSMLYEGELLEALARFVHLYHSGAISAGHVDIHFVDVVEDHIRRVMEKWNPHFVDVDAQRSVYLIPDDGSSRFPSCSAPYNAFLPVAAMHTYLSSTSSVHTDKAR